MAPFGITPTKPVRSASVPPISYGGSFSCGPFLRAVIVATGSDSAATPTPFTVGSGIVGLGLTAVPNFADSLLGQQFMIHPNRSTVNVGFALGSDSAQGSNAGQMHVLAPDPGSYTGDIQLVNVASVNAAQKPPNLASTDWAVPVTQWVFSNNGGGSANSPSAFVAIPEISLPSIYMPSSAAPTICESSLSSSLRALPDAVTA